jgi:hypothetical protein
MINSLRYVLSLLFVLAFSLNQSLAESPAGSTGKRGPGWRVIFDNDTTNIFNCVSPFNATGDATTFTEAMLRASVAEAAVPGVDAQLLQPGVSWVPWWPSKILPLAE